MRNVTMSVSDNELTIKIDLSKNYGKSSSGKTDIIASTDGNVNIPESADIKIGLNVYCKPKTAEG